MQGIRPQCFLHFPTFGYKEEGVLLMGWCLPVLDGEHRLVVDQVNTRVD